jgi:hypothetical protein
VARTHVYIEQKQDDNIFFRLYFLKYLYEEVAVRSEADESCKISIKKSP